MHEVEKSKKDKKKEKEKGIGAYRPLHLLSSIVRIILHTSFLPLVALLTFLAFTLRTYTRALEPSVAQNE